MWLGLGFINSARICLTLWQNSNGCFGEQYTVQWLQATSTEYIWPDKMCDANLKRDTLDVFNLITWSSAYTSLSDTSKL